MIYWTQFLFFVCLKLGWPANFTRYLFEILIGWVATIEGACRSSGMCCRSIQLYANDVPITKVSDWRHFLREHPEFNQFRPAIFSGAIQSFDCNYLTSTQRCGKYESRPNVCREYPSRFFLTHGRIHSNCGYAVKINHDRLQRLWPSIRLHMSHFLHV